MVGTVIPGKQSICSATWSSPGWASTPAKEGEQQGDCCSLIILEQGQEFLSPTR